MAPHVHMMKSFSPALNRIAFLTYKNTRLNMFGKIFVSPKKSS
jgi:hypothetical protein